jgi:hypothetical protein
MEEMKYAELGDARRPLRAARILQSWAEHPESSIPAAGADRSQTNLTYRFLATEQIVAGALLESHRRATLERMAEHEEVWVAQDTTSLDFTSLGATAGLGPLESRYTRGLFLHSALALTPQGTPLGLLGQQYWARQEAEQGKRAQRRQKEIAQKESAKWLGGLRACEEIPEGVRVLLIGDAESDVYEVLAHPRAPQVDLLVRAAQDRRLEGQETLLWQTLAEAPRAGTLQVELGRSREREPRVAHLEVRFEAVTLAVPRHRKQRADKAPVALWALHVHEGQAPAGEEAIEWLLLSTRPVRTLPEAVRLVEAYGQRWKVERFHYVLKSGCRVEHLQLESRSRLERALVLYSIVAWRLLHLTYRAREMPEAPCSEVLEAAEWKILYRRTHPRAKLPEQPPTLREAVLWLGRLGGYMGSNQKSPGVKTLWRGMRRLHDLIDGARLLAPDL